MKKHWKAIAGFMICLGILFGAFRFFVSHNEIAKKDKVIPSTAVETINASFTGKKDRSRVILEVVPDPSYAQLGYMQMGYEPINILEACKEGKAAQIQELVGEEGVELITSLSEPQYDELSELYKDVYSNFSDYWDVVSVTGSSVHYEFKDGMEFVYNKNLLESKLEDILYSNEKVVVKTVTVEQLNSASKEAVATLLDNVDVLYLCQSYASDTQRELAQTYSLEKDKIADAPKTFLDNDLDWKVVNWIFERVGAKTNPLSLMMDSSIYDGALDASSKSVNTVQYQLNRSVKYDSSKWGSKSKREENIKELIGKTSYAAASGKKASNNNAYKLYLMSMFRDPAEFYNLFLECGALLIDDNGSYVLQDGDAKNYWNVYTFLPCRREIKSSDHEAGDEGFWTGTMGITLELANKNAINGNVVSLDVSKGSLFKRFFKDTESFYELDSKNSTSYSAAELIDIMELYEPHSFSTGGAMVYDVLELQPAKGYELVPAEVEKMIPYTSYTTDSTIQLKITKMTTAEFIGKTDTLSSVYDMIYIGKCIDGFHKKDNKPYAGISDKSDGNMGIIYAHVGSKVKFGFDNNNHGNHSTTSKSDIGASNGYALFPNASEASLRYSGNDITSLKKNELEEYLKCGLPVLVADGLVDDASKTDASQVQYFNDLKYNNMYQFLRNNKENLITSDYNYRTAKADGTEGILARLTYRKPTLTVNSVSAPAAKETIGSSIEDNMVFEFDKTDANRRFTFSFKVDNPANTSETFVAKLFVDKNADGRYVEGKGKEMIGTKEILGNGNPYTYTFNMNTNYSGAFTWKLMVYPKSNPKLICSKIGYSTIRFTDGSSARNVKVLQVQAVKDGKPGEGRKHSTDWGYNKAQQVQLNNSSFVKDYLQTAEIKKDFKIDLTLITLQQFLWDGWYDGNGLGDFGTVSSVNKNAEEWHKYDMVIFGFADSYRDMEFDNVKFAKSIEKYITLGKSVLFTHDLTSQIVDTKMFTKSFAENNSAGDGTNAFMETTNGRAFNQWLREAMGLNRFGQSVYGDKSYIFDKTKHDKTETSEKYAFTYSALMQYSNFRRDAGKAQVSGWYGPYKNLYINLDSADGFPNTAESIGYVTRWVSKVNDGQITKYPYKLEDSSSYLNIAPTHGQYFQLNMEDEEVVCWFTLSDSHDNGWYSSSPNDVANNYYIYNKGNVTYSGVGHSRLEDDSNKKDEMTSFEKKLFVNTIIAALRAGVEGPMPTITNGLNIPDGAEDRYVVYADVDVDSADEDFAKREEIKFYVTDDSSDSDYMYVALEDYVPADKKYVELTPSDIGDSADKVGLYDQSGNYIPMESTKFTDIGGKTHYVWKIKISDLDTSTGVAEYTIKYPLTCLKDEGCHNIKIVTYNEQKAVGYQYGALMRRPLFKLD